MTDNALTALALSLVAALFGILTMLLGWLGAKLYSKLDEMSKNLILMASELHNKINGIDLRLTKVETRCDESADHFHKRAGQ